MPTPLSASPAQRLLPSPLVSTLPTPLQQVLVSPLSNPPDPLASSPPADVGDQPAGGSQPQPAPSAPFGGLVPAAAGRAPTGTAAPVPRPPTPAGPAAARLLQAAVDTPLGPAPPVIGLLLVLLSALLFVRRRVRQRERDRALDDAKIHFLKVASHELRTPLTVIGGYVSMAADGSLGPLPERMRMALPTLHEEINQLERLVEQMLLATRLDEGLLQLERRRLDLREVAAASVQGVPAGDRRRLVVDLPPEPVVVTGDRSALQLVARNLVENALKYSPAEREVRVRVDADWRRGRLSVSDRGIGIARDDLGLLFTRFGRIVNAENSHVFGSGLGLYLSRGIARMQGGDIAAESAEARGSTFSLDLPLAVPVLKRWARRLGLAPSPESPAPEAGAR